MTVDEKHTMPNVYRAIQPKLSPEEHPNLFSSLVQAAFSSSSASSSGSAAQSPSKKAHEQASILPNLTITSQPHEKKQSSLGVRVRRRRVNHNEIERARRVALKERLEELRMAIPVTASDPGASMVAIITAARDYIFSLNARIAQLEGGINDTVQRQDVLMPQPQFRSPKKLNTGSRSPSELSLGSNSSGRKSSLLFPTHDSSGIIKAERDSLHNLFSGLFPSFMEDSFTDIRCDKCHGGIQNLIMIDCDVCHAWYHIRCVGIATNGIPAAWTCKECGGKQQQQASHN